MWEQIPMLELIILDWKDFRDESIRFLSTYKKVGDENFRGEAKENVLGVITIGSVPQNGIYGKEGHVEGKRTRGNPTCSLLPDSLVKALLRQMYLAPEVRTLPQKHISRHELASYKC